MLMDLLLLTPVQYLNLTLSTSAQQCHTLPPPAPILHTVSSPLVTLTFKTPLNTDTKSLGPDDTLLLF